jgi:redox-sensitive bicupin YhaK (pirin superfamily)
LGAGGKVLQEVPKGWNAFVYLLTGQATFGSGEGKRVVKRWHNVVFEQDGDSIEVSVDTDAKESAHFGESICLYEYLLFFWHGESC